MVEKNKVLVDINLSSADELISVRGIGLSLANRIIENRPYETLNDLISVQGINQVKLGTLLPYLTVAKETPKPVHKEKLSDKKQGLQPASKFGETEAFVFLENRNERQDALLIVLIGFVFGLIILFLRRSDQ